MEIPSTTSPLRFRIEDRVGEGGLGQVFRAWDTVLQRHVALKRLSRHGATDDASCRHAWQEAVHLAAVQHPNVVTVYDCGVNADGPFLVMELVEGETLEEVVARGAFPLRDFCILVHQSLDGLAAAHQVGLLHRDLKPGNVMLKHGPTNDLQVKLLDFGIAGFTPAFDNVLPLPTDDTGTILGTVEFMAPEQFEQQPVSERGELYSMGCIFYYALTGTDPFQGKTVAEIIASHLAGRLHPLETMRRDLPPVVSRWVTRLLSRRPEDRPASVLQALAEFTGLFDELSPNV